MGARVTEEEGVGGEGGETHGRKPMAGNPWPETHGWKPMAGNPWPETHGRKPKESEGGRAGLMKTTVLLAVGGAQRAAFDGWWGAKPEERRELAGDAWGLGLKVGEGGGGRGGRCPWPETHGRKPMAGNPWVGAHGREHMAGNPWPEI